MKLFFICLAIALGSLQLSAANTLPVPTIVGLDLLVSPVNYSVVVPKVDKEARVCCTASHSDHQRTVQVCIDGNDGNKACRFARAMLDIDEPEW